MDINSSRIKKRQRAVNWDEVEKAMLLDCLVEEIKIVENKKKLTLYNNDRSAAWRRIKNKMEIQGYNRDVQRIKEQWQRMKVQAKKAISQHKKNLKQTGGGPPQLEPTEIEWRIKDLLPHEFIEDYSSFDCDFSLKPQHIVESRGTAGIEMQLNPHTGILESIVGEEDITVMYEEGPEGQTETEAKERTDAVNTPETEAKERTDAVNKRRKIKSMTEYGQKLYELNKMRILQVMQQSEEMHKLKLENEKEYQRERMRKLQMH